jgi:hypothetical protein
MRLDGVGESQIERVSRAVGDVDAGGDGCLAARRRDATEAAASLPHRPGLGGPDRGKAFVGVPAALVGEPDRQLTRPTAS